MSAVCLRCGAELSGRRLFLVRPGGGCLCRCCERWYALEEVKKEELCLFLRGELARLPRAFLLDAALMLEKDFLEWYYSGAFVRGWDNGPF